MFEIEGSLPSDGNDPFLHFYRQSARQAACVRSGWKLRFLMFLPLAPAVDAVRKTFQDYLDFVPEGALNWGAIGPSAEEWKPLTSRGITRCLSMLTPTIAAKRRLMGFELKGDESGAGAPGFGFTVFGGKTDDKWPNRSFEVLMSFPHSYLTKDRIQSLVDFAERVAERLPYVSGYLSPAFLTEDPMPSEASFFIRQVCLGYPGMDVSLPDTALRIGRRVTGARWLTFLGEELSSAVGGVDRIRDRAVPGLIVAERGGRTLLRAGEVPEIGDTEHGIGTPLLAAMARILEPVTYFDDIRMWAQFANRDVEFFHRWSTRFLGKSQLELPHEWSR